MASFALIVSPLAAAAPPELEPPPLEAAEPEIESSEPVPLEAAEPEPEPTSLVPALPDYDALPSYDKAPPSSYDPRSDPWSDSSLTESAEPIPRDGNGSLGAGVLLLGGGVTLAITSGVLITMRRDTGIWIAGASLSGVAVATGGALLVVGMARRRAYQPWRLEHKPPMRGTGLIATGSLTISAGAIGLILGGISLQRERVGDPPYGLVLLSLGTPAFFAGMALLIGGSYHHRNFGEWELERLRLAPSVGLLPGLGPGLSTAGASVGMSGRF